MLRMLICLHAPVEIVNLVSSIQVTSKALEIAGSLVFNLSDVQSSFRICNPFGSMKDHCCFVKDREVSQEYNYLTTEYHC
jgi:hypothetical protein